MFQPKLACCNFFTDVKRSREFGLDYGFDGIDWTLRLDDIPPSGKPSQDLARSVSRLKPLDVRYHLSFKFAEIGHVDQTQADLALSAFRRAINVVWQLGGRFITLHIGLGRDSMEDVSWEKTLAGLAGLADLARSLGIYLCLENLAQGWTSRPQLYEKLIRKTSCWGTLDLGHARVCRSVKSQAYDVEDFVIPHPKRILNAHVYHEETSAGHIPPDRFTDLYRRLRLVHGLPSCDWWTLELREETALLQTLGFVNEFLQTQASRAAI
jgi:sugar phosphate isomerase/epimerase